MSKFLSLTGKVLCLCLIIGILSTGCAVKNNIITGEGKIENKNYDLSNFKVLEVSRDFQVKVSKGDEFSVEVETNADIFQYLVVEVVSDTLYAKYKDDVVIDDTVIAMNITMPSLESAFLKNDVQIKLMDDFYTEADFNLRLENDSQFTGTLYLNELSIELKSDTQATIKGSAVYVNATGRSDSHLDLKGLETHNASVNVANSALCELKVLEEVNVTAENDAIVKILGGGKINKIEVGEDTNVTNVN